MFQTKRLLAEKERLIIAQATQISDLLSLLERREVAHAEQVKELTNKIMALAVPSSLGLLNPAPRPAKPFAQLSQSQGNFTHPRPPVSPEAIKELHEGRA